MKHIPVAQPATLETTAIPATEALGVVALFAVLAYPTREEWSKRNEFVSAWNAAFVKRALKRGLPRQKARAEYRSRPNQQINNVIEKGIRRIVRWRLPAATVLAEMLMWGVPTIGRMLLAPVLGELQRQNPEIDVQKLKIKITKPSPKLTPTTRRVIGLTQFSVDDDSTKRFLRRHWKSTLPVLPLALALRSARLENPEAEFVDLVENPAWLSKALRQADLLAGHLSSQPDFQGIKFVRLVPEKKS